MWYSTLSKPGIEGFVDKQPGQFNIEENTTHSTHDQFQLNGETLATSFIPTNLPYLVPKGFEYGHVAYIVMVEQMCVWCLIWRSPPPIKHEIHLFEFKIGMSTFGVEVSIKKITVSLSVEHEI